jgi:hypothetical protein
MPFQDLPEALLSADLILIIKEKIMDTQMNNQPAPKPEMTEGEKITATAIQILDRFRAAFEELAK